MLRAHAKEFFKNWSENLFSWNYDLGLEILSTENGLFGLLIPGSEEYNSSQMKDKLQKIIYYVTEGPPNSDLTSLAKATFAFAVGFKKFSPQDAKISVEIGIFRLQKYVNDLLEVEDFTLF